MATVVWNCRLAAGQTGFTLEIYPKAGGAIVNTGGDALTEASPVTQPGTFTATVTETIASNSRCDILKSGLPYATGWIDPSVSYVIDDPLIGPSSTGGPGGTVVVTPITSYVPSDVVGVEYPRALGDVSPITIYAVKDSTGALVDLNSVGALYVAIIEVLDISKPNEYTLLESLAVSIGGTGNADYTFTPTAASMNKVCNNRYAALRRVSDDKSFSEIRFNIRVAAIA
jgi:hypothetical protein